MSKIALTHGNDRYQNIISSLSLLKEGLKEAFKNKKRIVVKVNFVVTNRPLAATQVDAVRALLDFLLNEKMINKDDISSKRIIITEGSFEETMDGYKNYGYFKLQQEYGVELKDLNHDETKSIKIDNKKFNLSKTILESDFRISVTPPKTHDTVVVTASLKNLIIGSIVVSKFSSGHYWRGVFHEDGYRAANFYLSELAKTISPDLAIIDGFEAMEGNGPADGDPVDWKIAISSLDWLAADILTAYLMGFDYQNIGYLYYCARDKLGVSDFNQMEIVGEKDYNKFRRSFKRHRDYSQQIQWKNH